MSEKMPPPKHAFELEVHVGGETWDLTLRELERLTEHVREHGTQCNMASGGAGTASHIAISTRDVTPEAYRDELEAWCEARRGRAGEEVA